MQFANLSCLGDHCPHPETRRPMLRQRFHGVLRCSKMLAAVSDSQSCKGRDESHHHFLFTRLPVWFGFIPVRFVEVFPSFLLYYFVPR